MPRKKDKPKKKSRARRPQNSTPSGVSREEQLRQLAEAGKPYRFQPGESGNPGGRPKGLTRLLRQILGEYIGRTKHTRAELLIRAMLQRAINKSDTLAKEILDRVDGKISIDLGEFGTADIETVPPRLVVNFVNVSKNAGTELPKPQISVKPPLPPEEPGKEQVIEMQKKAG